MIVDGIDYGSIVYDGVTYELGPGGPVDPEVRAKLEWGKAKRCEVCGDDLGFPGGFGGTDLCGMCCTGESARLGEKGVTW